MFLKFGGSVPNDEEGPEFKRTMGYFLGHQPTLVEAIADCIELYSSNGTDRIEWFEILEVTELYVSLVYDDVKLDKMRAEKRESEAQKAVTPEYFILIDSNSHPWSWSQFKTLKEAFTAAKERNANRWQIRSQPQGKTICHRISGFPGMPVDETATQYDMVQRLLLAYGLI